MVTKNQLKRHLKEWFDLKGCYSDEDTQAYSDIYDLIEQSDQQKEESRGNHLTCEATGEKGDSSGGLGLLPDSSRQQAEPQGEVRELIAECKEMVNELAKDLYLSKDLRPYRNLWMKLDQIKSLLSQGNRRRVKRLQARQVWADHCDADMSMTFSAFISALLTMNIELVEK